MLHNSTQIQSFFIMKVLNFILVSVLWLVAKDFFLFRCSVFDFVQLRLFAD
jgi:hypothetical protein